MVVETLQWSLFFFSHILEKHGSNGSGGTFCSARSDFRCVMSIIWVNSPRELIKSGASQRKRIERLTAKQSTFCLPCHLGKQFSEKKKFLMSIPLRMCCFLLLAKWLGMLHFVLENLERSLWIWLIQFLIIWHILMMPLCGWACANDPYEESVCKTILLRSRKDFMNDTLTQTHVFRLATSQIGFDRIDGKNISLHNRSANLKFYFIRIRIHHISNRGKYFIRCCDFKSHRTRSRAHLQIRNSLLNIP